MYGNIFMVLGITIRATLEEHYSVYHSVVWVFPNNLLVFFYFFKTNYRNINNIITMLTTQ